MLSCIRAIWVAGIASLLLLMFVGCSGSSGSESDVVDIEASTAQGAEDPSLSSMVPEELQEKGLLRMATAPPFAPYEMFTEEGSNELVGIDVELADAIAQRLGLEVEHAVQSFDGIIPSLQAGKADFAMSSITITDEREAVIGFVPYSINGAKFMVMKGNPLGIMTKDDICGKRIGVAKGTTFEEYLAGELSDACTERGEPPVEVLRYPLHSDTYVAMQANKVDGVLTNATVAEYTAQTAGDGDSFEAIRDPAAPHGYWAAELGIGLDKDNAALKNAMEAGLDAIIEDGTYQAILEKYAADSSALREAGSDNND